MPVAVQTRTDLRKVSVRSAPAPAPRVIYASIVIAALAAYWPALRGGLVWDDNAHVTAPALQSLHGLWRIWFSLGATQQYYPLLHSAFWLEHRLWGDAVLGYHLVNLVQHAIAACLVVAIVRRLQLPGAWLAGLVFALHPVCVESVAWISEQKSTLSAVFYLGSFLLFLHFDRTRRRSFYIWATALFLCALLTKSVTATLPAALLVVLWWKRALVGRAPSPARVPWTRWSGNPTTFVKARPGRTGASGADQGVRPTIYADLLPWFGMGAVAGLFTAWVERTYIGAQGADFAIAPVERFLIAGRVLWFYAAKLVWPANLMFTYPRWNINPAAWWQWLFPLTAMAVAIGLWLLARRSTRGPLAAFLYFAGTLFPVLGFLNVYPFRFSWVADHFQYLACLGIIVPLCAMAGRLTEPRVLSPLLVILAVLTFRQAGAYAGAETLYRETLARNPASWMAHNNLGVALAQQGRTPEAIAEYQAALRIKPDYAEPHNNMAKILSREPGRMPEAMAEVREALRLKPEYPEALVNLGSFLAPMPGRLPEAIAAYQAALRINPSHAEAHNDLGLALLEMPGRLPDAVAELEAAVQSEPDNAQMHDNLAGALARMPGRLPDAIAEVQAALAIAPGDPQAHDFLGRALSQMPGRLPDAIAEFETAQRLAPNYAQAHNDLGVVLLYVPDRRGDAITEFRAALALNPGDPQAQSNLQRAISQP